MLKRWDSAYVPGRPKGPWFKWKRDPHIVDAVLMYAQRGHGKRSSFYSDYTFGVWTGPDERAGAGAGRQGLFRLHRRGAEARSTASCATTPSSASARCARCAPSRTTAWCWRSPSRACNRSTRHRSGVAMRFPRISRLRWDKPPAEADRLETLEKLLPAGVT